MTEILQRRPAAPGAAAPHSRNPRQLPLDPRRVDAHHRGGRFLDDRGERVENLGPVRRQLALLPAGHERQDGNAAMRTRRR
mgnify:CR=1 FL=1